MLDLACPVCGTLVLRIDTGSGMARVDPPIVFAARCRNRRPGACRRPLITWEVTYRGRVAVRRLDSLATAAVASP